MKYVVDVDALVDCIELVRGGMKVNGDIYVPLDIVKEFIVRFPRDFVKEEETND